MPPTSPFDLLAEELGAVAGRVEREAALRITALTAELERRFAEKELQLERLQKILEGTIASNVVRWDQVINERVSSLKDGKDGADGKDGKDGAEGQTGPAGEPSYVPGPQGVQGVQGAQGERGEMGPAGKDGLDGAPGLSILGEKGEQGLPGERGEQGLTGISGKDGHDGERGPQGIAGKLPRVKAWIEGSVHYDGDVVTHKGGLYQALQDTAKTPGTNEWICLAAAGVDGKDGRDGEDGRSLAIKETFDPAQKYKVLDVVTLDSKWFVAKHDDPGTCPGPGWKAGPGIGKTGKPGPQGERGLKGEVGRAALAIVEWETRAETFEIIPLMSDGSRGPAVSIRELFLQFQVETG